jgi:hypothetical protein
LKSVLELSEQMHRTWNRVAVCVEIVPSKRLLIKGKHLGLEAEPDEWRKHLTREAQVATRRPKIEEQRRRKG